MLDQLLDVIILFWAWRELIFSSAKVQHFFIEYRMHCFIIPELVQIELKHGGQRHVIVVVLQHCACSYCGIATLLTSL